ncbi:hypothetical protein Q5692_34325 [Microcoleus sp. C2C3]
MLVKIAIGHKPSLLPRSNTLKDRNALIAIASGSQSSPKIV